jgi:hypothetical protein
MPRTSANLKPFTIVQRDDHHDTYGINGRCKSLESFVQDMTEEGDLEGIMQVLRDARSAITTIRAPRDTRNPVTQVLENQYEWVPDHGMRLAAVRIHLAYLIGNPKSQVEIRKADTTTPATVEEQVALLRESGTDLKAIMDTWLGAAKDITPKPSLSQPVQPAEGTQLIDV